MRGLANGDVETVGLQRRADLHIFKIQIRLSMVYARDEEAALRQPWVRDTWA